VGILNNEATKSIGPLAKPPVPITKSGRNFKIIRKDFTILKSNFKGNNKFLKIFLPSK
jgi:hypothetical protein